MHWTLPAIRSRRRREFMTSRRVAQDQSVRPVHLVLVEGQLLVDAELRVGEERPLDLLSPDRPEDRRGRHALVDVEADGVDVEAGVLRLAGPDQLGILVGIEGREIALAVLEMALLDHRAVLG